MLSLTGGDRQSLTLGAKFRHMPWAFLVILALIASIGIAMLYSASGGNWSPWADRQMIRFAMAATIMLAIALVDIRVWYRYAYVIYFVALALLGAVEVVGSHSMGAQRWISLGFFQLQPSEVMKVALIIGLARYFHGATLEDAGRLAHLIVPAAMIAAPALLVMRQPDLGTAVMLAMGGATVLFLAGVRLWVFGTGVAGVLAMLPVAWSLMHDYQRRRIFTFLDPEQDPLGAGYHILQSKIALGSGAIFGKGFLKGSQSHLNFVPEKQTDFIFSMLAEEFGLAGGVALVSLYLLALAYAVGLTLRIRNQFGRLLGAGIATIVFLYVFINMAMVMGLVPVVGVPLPLISYGGTAMLSLMAGFGFLLSATIHRDAHISRFGSSEE